MRHYTPLFKFLSCKRHRLLTPDALYVMKHQYKNNLAKFRTNAEVSIEILALISHLNQKSLRDMESGKQRPTLSVIAMYHLLFGASFKELFTELCADTHTYLIEHCENLIYELGKSSSPKSNRIIQALKYIVNMLNQDFNDQ